LLFSMDSHLRGNDRPKMREREHEDGEMKYLRPVNISEIEATPAMNLLGQVIGFGKCLKQS